MFEQEIEKTLSAITPLVQHKKRLIVAIAGPPAAGKSTFSENLLHAIRQEEPETELVPMDGFHYDNRILDARGHLPRKGAHLTFDAMGVVSLVKRIKSGEDNIAYPIFDRTIDCAIAGAGIVQAKTKIILIEGNYLLLDKAPWSDLAPTFDLSILVSAPIETLEQRLIQRWLDHDHTLGEAKTRAHRNDIPNAHYVLQNSCAADLSFISYDA